jgi:hypothetical protein
LEKLAVMMKKQHKPHGLVLEDWTANRNKMPESSTSGCFITPGADVAIDMCRQATQKLWRIARKSDDEFTDSDDSSDDDYVD